MNRELFVNISSSWMNSNNSKSKTPKLYKDSNLKIIISFPYDEEKPAVDITFHHYEVVTHLLFEKGKSLYNPKPVNQLRDQLLSQVNLANTIKKLPLYVSQGIIEIIKRELKKIN